MPSVYLTNGTGFYAASVTVDRDRARYAIERIIAVAEGKGIREEAADQRELGRRRSAEDKV